MSLFFTKKSMSINSHINNWIGISPNNYESTCRIQGYDSVCVPCDAGKFGSVAHGKQSCVACLSNTSSASASTACTECPLHTWAEPGSGECSCDAGYMAHFDAAGNRKAPFCWTCDAGKYKPPMASDSTTCKLCPRGTYSAIPAATRCLECPANSASEDHGRICTCAPGFHSTSSRDVGVSEGCIACDAGYFKALQDMHSCSACPAGSYSLPGDTRCRACPDFTFSEAGSARCGCFMGFTGPDNGPCSSCPAASYKSVNGSTACSACPPLTWAPASTISASACVAIPDTRNRSNTRNCSPCPDESFQTRACSNSSDRLCQGCISCGLGYWERTLCSPEFPRQCALCSWCKPSEFESRPCSQTADRSCSSCTVASSTEYYVSACTWSRNSVRGECSTLSCPAGQYTEGCGWGDKGRGCVPCQNCPAGQFRKLQGEHGIGCGGVHPGVCEACPNRTFSIGTGPSSTCTACRALCALVEVLSLLALLVQKRKY